jgi:hypothetical protein
MKAYARAFRLSNKVLPIVLLLALVPVAWGKQDPHYAFVLPDGYTGWIQIIFASPKAPRPEFSHNRFLLRVDDSGVFRTSMLHSVFAGSQDEFFYRRIVSNGKESLVPVPAEYFCGGNSGVDNCFISSDSRADAIEVGRATVGRVSDGTPGDSWFLFVGPYALREKMAKHVHLDPGTSKKIDVPEDDPIPGRIKDEK